MKQLQARMTVLSRAKGKTLEEIYNTEVIFEEAEADRAHRMGQKKSVQVIKMIARGTIEEKMHELQQKKRHLIADILEENPVYPSTLTEEDVREILMI